MPLRPFPGGKEIGREFQAVTLPNRGRKGHLLGVASLAREAGDGSQKAYYWGQTSFVWASTSLRTLWGFVGSIRAADRQSHVAELV